MIKARILPASDEFNKAAKVSMNRGASPDERRDASRQVAKTAAPYAAQLDPGQVMALANAAERFAKAEDRPEALMKRTVAIATVDVGGDYRSERVRLQRPVGLDFAQLRLVVKNDPILDSIITTRCWQVMRFMRPSTKAWSPGFKIGFPENVTMDRTRIALEHYLANSSLTTDPRERRKRKYESLMDFTQMHIRDSLTLDAAPIEHTYMASGEVHGYVPVDAARVFLTDPTDTITESDPDPEIQAAPESRFNIPDPDDVIAVLARDERVTGWYTHDNLMYPVRRKSTDTYQLGYGDPEVERLIRIVTGFTNALALNLRGFTHNSLPKGFLTLFGDFDDDDLENFKTEWEAYVTGTSNLWKLPALVSQDRESGATYTAVDNGFNEQYFSKWMTFLVAIETALYGMDPEEINFEAFTSNNSSLAGSDTEERLASSKDKGLWPLLTWYGSNLDELVKLQVPDAKFEWTGLDAEQQLGRDEQEKTDTFAEYRHSRGMDPTGIPELDNAPMNPGLQGVYQNVMQAQMQAEAPPEGEPEDELEPGQGDVEGQGEDEDEQGRRTFQDEEGEGWGVEDGANGFAKAQEQTLWP